jgi:23S rRNA pseudouridine1911/1915/1917 synthase
MIAVNKPPHLVVHPAPGHWQGTFVNALLGHLAKKGASIEQVPGQELRPGIVHRLDKGAWVRARPCMTRR